MQSWPGRALDPSLPEGRADCTLRITPRELLGELPDGTAFALPLEVLAFERQGFEGQILAFSRTDQEFPRLTSRDPKLLDALLATNHVGALRAIGAERHHANSRIVRYWVIPAALLVLAVVGSIWFVSGPLISLTVAALPPSADVELGKLALKSTLAELGKEVEGERGEKARAALTAVLKPLTSQVEGPYEFDLHVVESEMVNAFALPGGPIVVTTAMLEQAPSMDAVAGVLAHEVSHVTHRHGVRGMVQRLGMWVLVTAVLGDASGIIALVSDNAASLASLGFSRDMESEADRSGLALISRAGFDRNGLRAFFQFLSEKEEKEDAFKLPKFLSTHPATEDRIAELEKLVAELPPAGDVKRPEVPWEEMRLALKGADAKDEAKPEEDAKEPAAAEAVQDAKTE